MTANPIAKLPPQLSRQLSTQLPKSWQDQLVTKLSDGNFMPSIGFGTWQLSEPYQQTLLALKLGYRHIDTAWIYDNEVEIGRAIADSGIPRQEIFVTTKINITQYPDAQAALELAFSKLNLDYIDLVLLHQPFGDVYAAWRVLEDYVRSGRIRSIGVSNFPAAKFVDFYQFVEIKPVVNQVECHLAYQRPLELKWAKEFDATLVAWSPLCKGKIKLENFTPEQAQALQALTESLNTRLVESRDQNNIAQASHTEVTLAQLFLAYQLRRDIAVIPKASSEAHLRDNLAASKLVELFQDSELAYLASLDTNSPIEVDHSSPEQAVAFYKRHLSRFRAWQAELAEFKTKA